MTEEHTPESSASHPNRWRIAAWTTAAFLLMLPLIAMQFTDQVSWTGTDFAFFGILLAGTGVVFEVTVRKTNNTAYRCAVALALAGAFLLVWVVSAVGITGAAGNRADLMYGGVLAVGVIGALIVRFRSRGMARALFATAFVQGAVAVITLIAGMVPAYNSAYEILGINASFVILFGASGLLFRFAGQEQYPAGTGPAE